MRLASAPNTYDRTDQDRARSAMNEADRRNLKRGEDIEMGVGRLVMTDEVTGDRYVVSVVSGALVLTAL